MATYYAITRRQGRWVCITSGADPEQVYRDAVSVLEGQEVAPVEELTAFSPITERLIDGLRVVTAESARDIYHVRFAASSIDLPAG